MSTMKFAAAAAAVSALALAGAAEAKPKHKHQKNWDGDHRYAQNWTPPGLAKKPGGMPPGQYKKLQRQYDVGGYLPNNYYRNDNYYVPQSYYGQYNLPPAPHGYQWMRVGNDVYLAQTRTGLISQVIADLFN